jgi:Flp pilus assembly protein TadG
VTATELAVLMPILIVLVLMPIQFALWWHGKQAADIAAEECVEAAQVLGADVAIDGAGGARAILGQAGNLTNVVITPTATAADTIECVITGDLDYAVIGHFSVTATAEGPIEHFVAEDDR